MTVDNTNIEDIYVSLETLNIYISRLKNISDFFHHIIKDLHLVQSMIDNQINLFCSDIHNDLPIRIPIVNYNEQSNIETWSCFNKFIDTDLLDMLKKTNKLITELRSYGCYGRLPFDVETIDKIKTFTDLGTFHPQITHLFERAQDYRIKETHTKLHNIKHKTDLREQ